MTLIFIIMSNTRSLKYWKTVGYQILKSVVAEGRKIPFWRLTLFFATFFTFLHL
jgi:hypothetical protein